MKFFFLSFYFTSFLIASVIRVPQDYSTITEAINFANSSDTIRISSGLYEESLNINKPIVILGDNKDSTKIQVSTITVPYSQPTIKINCNNVIIKDITISIIFTQLYNYGACIIFSESYNCLLENVDIIGGYSGIHAGGNCIIMLNSYDILINNVNMYGGNGGVDAVGAHSLPSRGGDCMLLNESINIQVDNSKLFPGTGSCGHAFGSWSCADPGYYISARENSNISIQNSEVNYDYYLDSTSTITLNNITNVDNNKSESDLIVFSLDQNYPNPFNPTTNISFSLPFQMNVNLRIFDSLGRYITSIFNGNLKKGVYTFSFDSSKLASGVYYYQLLSRNYTKVKKMIVIK